jgi:serine O-acetyltransferase
MFRHLVRHSLRRIVGPSVGGRAREGTPGGTVDGKPTDHEAGNASTAAKSPGAGHDRRSAAELDTWELLSEDFGTHDRDVFEPGLWAVLVQRLGARSLLIDSAPLRIVCDGAYFVLSTAVDWGLGISLPRTVQLGRRVRLWHSGCMFLTARSIGNDVHIRQTTTFGPAHGAGDSPDALPVIEDGADIGSGTCILGPVTVGHDAVVGANSVVLEDVPPHANVLGVPARTVPVWSIGARSNAADGSTKDAGLPLSRGDRNLNPAGMGLVSLLAEDFRTHGATVLSAGFWALAVHRLGNWRMGIRRKAFRAPLTLLYLAAYNAVIVIWGINLPYNGRVGRRLLIGGHGAVLMGAREIGDDVHVRSSVTMGLRRRTDPAAPTIGNRVQIEANACIIGNIHVGDDSVIGPNTVLARDVLPASTVLGVPGRRINAADYFQSAPATPPVPSVPPVQAMHVVKPVDGG